MRVVKRTVQIYEEIIKSPKEQCEKVAREVQGRCKGNVKIVC